MADFKPAYKVTSKHEGGWSNHPSDRGKETYAGISRKYHPDWEGWPIIDKIKNKKRHQEYNIPLLEGYKVNFYEREYWNKMKGNDIESQRIASFIYDWFVHSGYDGLKEVQEVLGVAKDGKIGPKTVTAINSSDESLLIKELISARLRLVKAIAANDPKQVANLPGWIKRINTYKR